MMEFFDDYNQNPIEIDTHMSKTGGVSTFTAYAYINLPRSVYISTTCFGPSSDPAREELKRSIRNIGFTGEFIDIY